MILPLNHLKEPKRSDSADVDVLRETLLAIGRIPMLTGEEEARLARGIEAAKGAGVGRCCDLPQWCPKLPHYSTALSPARNGLIAPWTLRYPI
ncbi:MAG: sigma-70 factor domain-containing protein [Pirellulaceae bacterium]